MKLLFITGQINQFGGVERTLSDKINYLNSRGHEICVVTYAQMGQPLSFILNDGVIFFDIDCRYFSFFKLPIYKRIWKLFKIKLYFRKRLSSIIQSFVPDVIIVTMAMNRFYLNDITSIAGNARIIVESHNIYHDLFVKVPISERIFYLFHHPLKTMAQADMLVLLTHEDAKAWKKWNVKNLKVIPNPLPLYLDKLSGCKRKEGRIISVGRLATEKRYDRLINAFAILADKYPLWYIDIYGYGPEEKHLLEIIKKQGLMGRIKIHKPTSQIYKEYESSQMLVLSSDLESFGLVLIEAMACGTPVVSVNCPHGPSEIIEDGKTGLLSEMNIDDLAIKMEWMIVHDTERAEMGKKAHLAVAKYKKDVIMNNWETAYESLY